MIKNENTAGGMFAYFDGINIVVASLATGDEVYRHASPFTLPNIGAYDSTNADTVPCDTADSRNNFRLFGAQLRPSCW
jgi:hypothetical protein